MKKKNKEIGYNIITWIIVIFFFSWIFTNPNLMGQGSNKNSCPYEVEGNNASDFVIKYVDSPYCFWCWLEEPILKKLVIEKGNSFRLERYDINKCTEIVKKYGFSGTPSFVFSLENETKEYTHFGFIDEDKFFKLICETTGDC